MHADTYIVQYPVAVQSLARLTLFSHKHTDFSLLIWWIKFIFNEIQLFWTI